MDHFYLIPKTPARLSITERQAAKRKDRINSLGGIMKRGKAECLDMDYIPLYTYVCAGSDMDYNIALEANLSYSLFSFMVQQ